MERGFSLSPSIVNGRDSWSVYWCTVCIHERCTWCVYVCMNIHHYTGQSELFLYVQYLSICSLAVVQIINKGDEPLIDLNAWKLHSADWKRWQVSWVVMENTFKSCSVCKIKRHSLFCWENVFCGRGYLGWHFLLKHAFHIIFVLKQIIDIGKLSIFRICRIHSGW